MLFRSEPKGSVVDVSVEDNQKAAEAFQDPIAKVVIPYERNTGLSAVGLRSCIENEVQLRYSKNSVQLGYYRQWIEAMSTNRLELFIEENEEQIQKLMDHKYTMSPWKEFQTLLVRNLLYTVELNRRQWGWDKAAKERVYTDYVQESALWKARHDVKMNEYLKNPPNGSANLEEEELPY